MIDRRGRDHRSPHQRHPDRGERDPVVQGFRRDHVAERIKRRFARDVSREPRHLALHPDGRDVHDVAETTFAHRWQQREDQPNGPEVVDRHGSFEIMHPVRRLRDAPPNGTTGIVDEVVDVVVFVEGRLDHGLHRFVIGDVARVAERRTSLCSNVFHCRL